MKYIIFSVIAHVSLLFVGIHINEASAPDLMRSVAMQTSLPATLVTDFTFLKTQEKINKPISKTKKIAAQPALGVKKAETNVNTMLTLLHRAIAKHQDYPESALLLQQGGKVSVAFIASPSGQLSDIHIIQSSENNSIDQAALAAVMHASPIPELANYLKKQKQFTIDILFD